MTDRSVGVIVPAYNEGGNLRRAVEGVREAAVLAGVRPWIIIVDDGSQDATSEVADHLHREYLDDILTVMRHNENHGLRAAYESGLSVLNTPYVTWVPGDGEMATESIAAILRAIGTADLVVPYHGTPENRPWFRRALTWISTTQLNLLLGHRLNYYQGTVVFPTEMARRLPRTVDGFFFCAEMLAHALEDPSIREVVEVPLEHRERRYGVSKAVSWRAVWRGQMAVLRIWRAVRLARTAPHRARQFAGT